MPDMPGSQLLALFGFQTPESTVSAELCFQELILSPARRCGMPSRGPHGMGIMWWKECDETTFSRFHSMQDET